MKYDHNEYEQMVLDLNISRSKKIILCEALAAAIITFIAISLIYKDYAFGAILALLVSLVSYIFAKKTILDSAKKANFIKNINYIEQTISEDKIIEKVVDYEGLENIGEYYFKDMLYTKEDNKNLYLYLNKNAAVIVAKNKIENINGFKEILISHNLLK